MPKGFALRFLGLFFVILDFLSGFAAYFAGFVTAALTPSQRGYPQGVTPIV
jgi:hypothetical protein